MKLETRKKDLRPLLACLALGTLYAMEQGVMPAEAGIWGLWYPLFKPDDQVRLLLSAPLRDVLATCDELDMLQQISEDEYLRLIRQLMHEILQDLGEAPAAAFRLRILAE